MKKWILYLLIAVLLTGCGARETMETVADEYAAQVMASPREISVRLPERETPPAYGWEGAQVYLSDEYEIVIETMAGGDLGATVQALCGLDKEQMTILETRRGEVKRYDFVWTTTGEAGDRLGRGVILDDGTYHYCMTALRDADRVNNTQIVWSDVFNSFQLL